MSKNKGCFYGIIPENILKVRVWRRMFLEDFEEELRKIAKI